LAEFGGDFTGEGVLGEIQVFESRQVADFGRDRALERFTIDRIVPRYESLYRTVLAGGDGDGAGTE